MDDPTVVVAIPTYNNEDSIKETLRLVFEQSRLPDRVVLCDASRDDTREVARTTASDYGCDDRLEIINQEGTGVSDAYDEILDHVSGDYDIFLTLQSELVVDTDWLAGHVECHGNHPEIGIVNGDCKANEPTDREVTADERPYYVGRNFSAKAGVLEGIDGWDRNFLRGEDWDMRIRLAGSEVRSYAKTALGYEWQGESGDDPYITHAKAKRRPTSLSFLSKYGPWYLQFHPSHAVSDALCLGGFVTAIGAIVSLPILPLAFLWVLLFGLFAAVFWVGHMALRGGVDGDLVVGPIRKQLLNGMAVLYAAARLFRTDPDWNTTGFDSENVPRYKF